jgi:hypothetical protein
MMADRLSSFNAVLSFDSELVAIVDAVVPLVGIVKGSIVVVNGVLLGSEVVGLACSSGGCWRLFLRGPISVWRLIRKLCSGFNFLRLSNELKCKLGMASFKNLF